MSPFQSSIFILTPASSLSRGKLKKAKKGGDKGALKAQKKLKGEKKSLSKEAKQIKKKGGKDKDAVVDEADLIATLEEYRKQWAEDHRVTGKLSSSLL
jgi:hypothetical protein